MAPTANGTLWTQAGFTSNFRYATGAQVKELKVRQIGNPATAEQGIEGGRSDETKEDGGRVRTGKEADARAKLVGN